MITFIALPTKVIAISIVKTNHQKIFWLNKHIKKELLHKWVSAGFGR